MTPQSPEGWKEKFREKFYAYRMVYKMDEIESFISDLLAQQRREILEEARKIAEDEMMKQRRIIKPYTLAAGQAAEDIAKAIRELGEKTPA